MLENEAPRTTAEDYQERILRACREIEQRLDEDIPLDELARLAHFSPFHFHRIFRGFTGETVREHARRLRLERAAHRLTRGDDDILTIALDSGYDSHEAFTRAFARRFGEPPSVFRSERRAILAPAPAPGAPDAPGNPQQRSQAMEIRIATLPARHVAYVRHVGPYNQVGDAWKALMKWGWSKMMFGKPDTFGLCYDDADVTDASHCRYDACIVVDEKTKPKAPVALQDLPAASFAVATHNGPYDRISETYAALFAAVASREIAGRRWRLGDPPSLEKYLNDPRKTKPEDLVTEVMVHVEA